MGGQQGGYLHLQTPATPSGPPVYQVPLNPVDAANAAMVDYDAEQRRAEQEEARLVKGYMAGGGHTGWFNGVKGASGGDHVAPSGLRFSVEPQSAAGIPCRSCSNASFELPAKTDRAKEQPSTKACSRGAALGTKGHRGNKRHTLKALQRMLQQAAAEGFRLLQIAMKQQRAGKATAENRSFFAGTTAAAAAAANGSNYCSVDASPTPVVTDSHSKTTKAKPRKGGVSLEKVAGQDTSMQLLQSLAQCSQELAKELDEQIRKARGRIFPYVRTPLLSRVKRRAVLSWRRSARNRKHGKRQNREAQSTMRAASCKHSLHSLAGISRNTFESASSSKETNERKRAQLLLKEELRRKVYEQMEARAATVQAQQASAEATEIAASAENGGHDTTRQSRVFKTGFDSEPPSSHGSYDTASEYESSDSAPTEAYVSPSSSSRSSSKRSSSRSSSEGELVEEILNDHTSAEPKKDLHATGRDQHPSRSSSIATAETTARRAKGESSSDASTDSTGSDQASFRLLSKSSRRESKKAGFQWLAGYSAKQQSRQFEAARRRRKPYFAVSMTDPVRKPLQQHWEDAEDFHQAIKKAQNHSPSAVQLAHGNKSVLESPEGVDLEAQRAGSFVSERGTLDSLPDSDVCEPSAACQPGQELPLLVSPPLTTLKRRIRSSSNNLDGNASRGATSCESLAAFVESLAPAEDPVAADCIQLRSREAQTPQKNAPINTEKRSKEFHCVVPEYGEEVLPSMATGGLDGGISARMQQAYASSLQRARNSVLSGSMRHATATLVSSTKAKWSASSLAALANRNADPSLVLTRLPAGSRSSNGAINSNRCGSHAAFENPAVGPLPDSSDCPNPAKSSPSGNSSHQTRRPAGEQLRGEAYARVTEKKAFMTAKEHGMMLDIDYDQANRDWNSSRNAGSGPPVSSS